jgi:hypothetical protein
MANVVTITNNYDNGVCNEFYIYTGTTFNGDPYVILNDDNLLDVITLPHNLNVGNYEGPLYIFLKHCDDFVTPPPDSTKKQGGFQVEFINIECFSCEDLITPTPTNTPTPNPTSTPNPTPTVDCDGWEVTFVPV